MIETRTPTLIKRYGRDRLYDGAAGRYVTIADLRAWQVDGIAFVVIDIETGQDVTRVLLEVNSRSRVFGDGAA